MCPAQLAPTTHTCNIAIAACHSAPGEVCHISACFCQISTTEHSPLRCLQAAPLVSNFGCTCCSPAVVPLRCDSTSDFNAALAGTAAGARFVLTLVQPCPGTAAGESGCGAAAAAAHEAPGTGARHHHLWHAHTAVRTLRPGAHGAGTLPGARVYNGLRPGAAVM